MTEATETAQYSVLCGRKALHYPDVSARARRAGPVMMIMMKKRQFWGCFASTRESNVKNSSKSGRTRRIYAPSIVGQKKWGEMDSFLS